MQAGPTSNTALGVGDRQRQVGGGVLPSTTQPRLVVGTTAVAADSPALGANAARPETGSTPGQEADSESPASRMLT